MAVGAFLANEQHHYLAANRSRSWPRCKTVRDDDNKIRLRFELASCSYSLAHVRAAAADKLYSLSGEDSLSWGACRVARDNMQTVVDSAATQYAFHLS